MISVGDIVIHDHFTLFGPPRSVGCGLINDDSVWPMRVRSHSLALVLETRKLRVETNELGIDTAMYVLCDGKLGWTRAEICTFL